MSRQDMPNLPEPVIKQIVGGYWSLYKLSKPGLNGGEYWLRIPRVTCACHPSEGGGYELDSTGNALGTTTHLAYIDYVVDVFTFSDPFEGIFKGIVIGENND